MRQLYAEGPACAPQLTPARLSLRALAGSGSRSNIASRTPNHPALFPSIFGRSVRNDRIGTKSAPHSDRPLEAHPQESTSTASQIAAGITQDIDQLKSHAVASAKRKHFVRD